MRNLARIAALAAFLAGHAHAADADPKSVHVYKSPTCGCCQKWVDHLKARGFKVEVSNVADLKPVKHDVGVPDGAASCHTAVVEGYFIEGHVPAADVERLLAERPKDVVGLALPGMPVGSPGMEGPNAQKYSVLAVQKDGKLKVFADH